MVWSRLKKSTLARSVGVYGLGNLFNSAVPFLLLPLLTRLLTREDYGLVAVFSALSTFVAPFCMLGLPTFLETQYFKAEKPVFEGLKIQAVQFTLIATGILAVIFLFGGDLIGSLASFPTPWL